MAAIDAPVTIKRYANQRLYSPCARSCVGLEHSADTVEGEKEIILVRARHG